MFIITDKKEKAIWITDTPFNKKSGVWHFYDEDWEYEFDLENFKDKYGSKFMMTIKKVQKMYKERGMAND